MLLPQSFSSARLLPLTGQVSARSGESKMPPELRGSRLDLRPLAAADEELYCAIYTDIELMRLVAAPLTADAAQRAFAAARVANASGKSHLAYWVLVERHQRVDIGLLGLLGQAMSDTAQVGAMILPAWHSRGYAAEAIAALADYAFSTLRLNRLHTRHAAANAAASGLMAKLGFVLIGTAAAGAHGHRWELRREHWRHSGLHAR